MPVSAAGAGALGMEGSIKSFPSALAKFGKSMKEGPMLRSVCSMLVKLMAQIECVSSVKSEEIRSAELLAFADKIYSGGLCSKECFVIALVYGQRIIKKKHYATMTSFGLRRLFLVSLLIASKFLDDFYCKNVYFARIGGLSTSELNSMELRLCFLLDFNLAITQDQFETSLFALSVESCFAASPIAWHVPAPVPVPRNHVVTKHPSAWPTKHDAAFAAEYDSAGHLPLDPSGIWLPLPHGAAPCALAPAFVPLWLCDPLGAANAWNARPYCPPA